ncbi:MAG: FAD-dependent monooxygenase [Gammaproteobacteria bacterium]
MNTIVDVAVVGGGVAGLCCAALFVRAGARVTVIEPALDRTPPSGPLELRTLAIVPAAARVLGAAGAWALLDRTRLASFTAMEVWDAGSSGRLEFAPGPSHDGPMGWIVENRQLVATLCRVLEASAARVISDSVVDLVGAGPVDLGLAGGGRLQARLVVAADGRASRLRGILGIPWHETPYAARALIANVTTQAPHGSIARQRFLPSGPLAFLPLPDPHASSIVWSCEETLAARLEALDDAAFRHALGEAFEQRLGVIEATTARASFPLLRARAESLAQGAVALVGDAAHVVHPLAGQGLNLGLLDVAALVECVGPPARESWPRPSALGRYARWRQSAALDMTLVTDGLERLFAREEAPLRWLRGLGLDITNRSGSLKRALVGHAMGNAGDVPRLARSGTV